MTSKTYVKVLMASFLVGIGISLVGCGSSGNSNPTSNYSPSIAPVVNGQTPNNCYYPSQITTALDGTQVCQMSAISTQRWDVMGILTPVLNPSNPNGPYSGKMNIYVQPNDKLTIVSLSGGWGSGSSDCKSIDFAGRDSRNGGAQLMNEGAPSGLYVSTGAATYPVFGPSTLYFNEAGTLRYGINVSGRVCSSAKLKFRLDRCLDVASVPHKCK